MTSSTAILAHNNKILLILRDNNPGIKDPNCWQLPGGGLEEGEDYFQAISRELKEEINIVPQQLKHLGSAPGDTKVFFAPLSNEEILGIKLGNEGQKLEFFSIEDAFKINLTKKLRFYLDNFKDGIIELIKNEKVSDIANLGLS